MNKTRFKRNSGITLIALIITIVVLLILAGVAIGTLDKSNIIGRAKETTGLYETKKTEEEQEIARAEELLDKYFTSSGMENEKLLITMYRAGENCKENNCTNEKHLHIGDYVNYEPDTNVTSYYPDDQNAGEYTGSTGDLQEVIKEELSWRVLGADGENVLLISGAPTASVNGGIEFRGYKGYNNYETILNTACATLYSKEGIGKARSINISDVKKYLGTTYNETTYSSGYEIESYGYTNTNITSEIDYDETTDTLTELERGITTTLSLTSKAFMYEANKYINDKVKLELLQGINCDYSYFMASRAIKVGERAFFGYDMLYAGNYICSGHFCFCNTDGDSGEAKLSLRPVITLDEDVTVEEISKVTETITENWLNPYF